MLGGTSKNVNREETNDKIDDYPRGHFRVATGRLRPKIPADRKCGSCHAAGSGAPAHGPNTGHHHRGWQTVGLECDSGRAGPPGGDTEDREILRYFGYILFADQT